MTHLSTPPVDVLIGVELQEQNGVNPQCQSASHYRQTQISNRQIFNKVIENQFAFMVRILKYIQTNTPCLNSIVLQSSNVVNMKAFKYSSGSIINI